MLKPLTENSEASGVFFDECGEIYLGSGHYTYVVENGELVRTEPISIPVVQNGRVRCILFATWENNSLVGLQEGMFYTSELNSRTFSGDFLVYGEKGKLHYFPEDSRISEQDYMKKEKETLELSSEQIINVYDSATEYEKIDLLEKQVIIKDGYKEEVELNASSKSLSVLNYAVSQSGDNTCWAAATATILRYRTRSTAYSEATMVAQANAWGTDISNGGTPELAARLLKNYGQTNYYVHTGQPSIATVKSNIDADYPCYMSMMGNGTSGHAHVLYGYSDTSDGNVVLSTWNPVGYSQTMLYQPGQPVRYYISAGIYRYWSNAVVGR